MTNYFLKRILWFIPTLIGISIVIFLISVKAPGNPIDQIISNQINNSKSVISKELIDAKVKALSTQFNMYKAVFYFSITNQTQSDTLYKIANKSWRNNLSDLAFQCGDWKSVNTYFEVLKSLEISAYASKERDVTQLIYSLKQQNKLAEIKREIELFQLNHQDTTLLKELNESIINLDQTSNQMNRYIPKFIFYGFNNQYHIWASSFIKGNFGISYVDRQSVATKIFEALKWTLVISLISIIISYLISIPLGIYLAKIDGSRWDKLISSFLFSIHSIPSFWLASLLILFFANAEYFNWFSSFGVGQYDAHLTIIEKITTSISHFTLPLICWTYASVAYISEQTKRSMLLYLKTDYVLTARAKGLSERKIYWKHAFKNASFPLITQVANLFPSLLAGSFVIEYIFAIPGIWQTFNHFNSIQRLSYFIWYFDAFICFGYGWYFNSRFTLPSIRS